MPEKNNLCAYCSGAVTCQSKLNISKLLKDTFKLYGQHFGAMCVVGLFLIGPPTIFLAFYVKAISLATLFSHLVKDFTAFKSDACLCFTQWLIQCYGQVVTMRQCFYTVRGGSGFKRTSMFPPFTLFLKVAGFSLICYVIFWSIGFGVGLVLSTLDNPSMSLTWSIMAAMCIGFCYIAMRLLLACFFLVDQNVGIIDSIKNSWKISSGNFWSLLVSVIVLFACFFVWTLCWVVPCLTILAEGFGLNASIGPGICLVNIGLVPMVAFIFFGCCLAYLQLTGQPHYLEKQAENDEP